MGLPSPSLTLVTDRKLYRPRGDDKADMLSVVEAAIAGGVDVVQFRTVASEGGDIAVFAVAMRLREMTAGQALFVVTGDVELAERCHADGILLPESSYKPSEARTFLRGDTAKLVGGFSRSVVAASRAERGGADYIQVGPIFSGSGPDSPLTGLALLRKIKDAVQLPVIAFGGILRPVDAVDCLKSGADGVAVTEAITSAPDPEGATSAFRLAIDAAWRVLHGD